MANIVNYEKNEENSNLKIINTYHDDVINAVVFNYYGDRMATCSSDRLIKIYEKDSKGEWIKHSEFVCDYGAIQKVRFAHPEYGNIIAAASMDRSVTIWEQREYKSAQSNDWEKRNSLLDSKDSIEDISFAPKSLGLLLASASATGTIRIYEFNDLLNIGSCQMINEINISIVGINSISWNPNGSDFSIAIGLKDLKNSYINQLTNINIQGGSGKLSEYQKQIQDYLQSEERVGMKDLKQLHPDLGEQDFRGNTLQIYHANKKGEKLQLLAKLKGTLDNDRDYYHYHQINDVSWCEQNGRDYHMLASCAADGLKVWYIKYVNGGIQIDRIITLTAGTNYRVSWSLNGNLLITSDKQNNIKVFQRKKQINWLLIKELKEVEDKIVENNTINQLMF